MQEFFLHHAVPSHGDVIYSCCPTIRPRVSVAGREFLSAIQRKRGRKGRECEGVVSLQLPHPLAGLVHTQPCFIKFVESNKTSTDMPSNSDGTWHEIYHHAHANWVSPLLSLHGSLEALVGEGPPCPKETKYIAALYRPQGCQKYI